MAGPNDSRTDAIAPESCAGDPEAKRRWAIDSMTRSAEAARTLGVDVVAGLTGSPIWRWVYPFPPVPREEIKAGFERFSELFKPILDAFEQQNVRFAHEVHSTSIAFDRYSFERSLEAVDHHPAFCLNFDPSHLYWQGVDPVCLIQDFPDRIAGTHFKDVSVSTDSRAGLLSSHLPFGQPDRGWDFRSPGRGDIDFEAIIRALNDVGYQGPLSVEWEDSGMDRKHGAEEAAAFLKALDFARPDVGFEEGLEI